MTRFKTQMESRAFWLKCWRSVTTGDMVDVWRYSLEDPRTGQRVGFASLEEMVAHIKSTLREENTREENAEK